MDEVEVEEDVEEVEEEDVVEEASVFTSAHFQYIDCFPPPTKGNPIYVFNYHWTSIGPSIKYFLLNSIHTLSLLVTQCSIVIGSIMGLHNWSRWVKIMMGNPPDLKIFQRQSVLLL